MANPLILETIQNNYNKLSFINVYKNNDQSYMIVRAILYKESNKQLGHSTTSKLLFPYWILSFPTEVYRQSISRACTVGTK